MINNVHLNTLIKKTRCFNEEECDDYINEIKNKNLIKVDDEDKIFYYLYWGKLLEGCPDINNKDFCEELLVVAIREFTNDKLDVETIIRILELMSKLDCEVDYSCGLYYLPKKSNNNKILDFYFLNCKNMLLEHYVEYNTELLYKYPKTENIFELIINVFFNSNYKDVEDVEYIFNELLKDIESYKLDKSFPKWSNKTKNKSFTNLFKNNYSGKYFVKGKIYENKLLLDFLTYLILADSDFMENCVNIDIDVILNHLGNDLINNSNSRFINCLDNIMPYLMSMDQESMNIFYNYNIFTLLYFEYVHGKDNKNFYPEILKLFKKYLDEYKWNEENRFNQIAVEKIDELYDKLTSAKCDNYDELFPKLLLTHNIMLDCHYEKKILKEYMKNPNKLFNYVMNS